MEKSDFPEMYPVVTVKIASEEIFFGPGIARLLKLIDRYGSIQQGCREMGLSYSKGAKIIKRAERLYGCPLLEKQAGGRSGGGSRLTEDGRWLLDRYDLYVEKVRQAAQDIFPESFDRKG